MNLRHAIPALLSLLALVSAVSCTRGGDAETSPVERGRYLVSSIGCADCHTPWHVGPNGPEPDSSRHLSGHPQDTVLQPAPELPAGWMFTGSNTMTAWSGPWGTSFTANLTPDAETGLGRWDAAMFRETIRTGRRMGRGRTLLPPMPWHFYRNLSDRDLDAIFAYLQSIPAIENRVPQPLPPANR